MVARLILGMALAVTPGAEIIRYQAPAGTRPAMPRPGAESVLPGGRIVTPLGTQHHTGPSPFGLVVSPGGRHVVSANLDPSRPSITVLRRQGARWRIRHHEADGRDRGQEWRGVSTGLAFAGENDLYVSEGASGRVRHLHPWNGRTRRVLSLDGDGYEGSFSGDLAIDRGRNLLFALDQANSRLAVLDLRRGGVLSSVRVEPHPFAVTLSPDAERVYVINGLAASDPEASNSLSVVNVEFPAVPRIEAVIRKGSFSSVAAAGNRVFVSDARNDSIAVIDARTLQVTAEIPIRIVGLEALRGVFPTGLAFDTTTGWLLVTEPGINAVGVIDTAESRVLGHLPAGWSPARVRIDGGDVYVSNLRGHGTGPNASRQAPHRQSLPAAPHRGAITVFPVPGSDELARHTRHVLDRNGFVPLKEPAPELPSGIRHVVLIVKGNRTFDDVFGDLEAAANGPVRAAPALARLGRYGWLRRDPRALRPRLDLREINITPNHHEMAARWAFSDNFYGSAGAPDHLKGCSNTEALWHHLERYSVSFRNYGGGLDPCGTRGPAGPPLDLGIPDQRRASQFIEEVERDCIQSGKPFPRFLYIRLPNSRLGPPRIGAGYPFEESYMADNDYALGRIVEFLSATPWWPHMAIFVTEAGAEDGFDHIDSHRTLLLVASPYARRNYVSRVNTGFPGILKTAFRLLDIPPLNLSVAAATDLSDCFTAEPDFSPFKALPPDERIFDPAEAR